MNRDTTKAIICAALGNIFWGFSFLMIRVGLDVAPDPNVMLSHRFLLSALFMGLMILMGKATVSFKGISSKLWPVKVSIWGVKCEQLKLKSRAVARAQSP